MGYRRYLIYFRGGVSTVDRAAAAREATSPIVYMGGGTPHKSSVGRSWNVDFSYKPTMGPNKSHLVCPNYLEKSQRNLCS